MNSQSDYTGYVHHDSLPLNQHRPVRQSPVEATAGSFHKSRTSALQKLVPMDMANQVFPSY